MALAWSVLGCAGINSAGPPAPLVEIPSAISIPGSLEVDVGEVGSAPPSAIIFDSTSLIQRFKTEVLPIGGEFFDAIVFGSTLNQLTNDALNSILSELSLLEIPTNPVTRNFAGNSAIAGYPLKIDFSDFDYSGTGTNYGCTGCTCPTGCDSACPAEAPFEDLKPICYRIWNDPNGTGDFVRLIAGVLVQVPFKDKPETPENEENPGVGSFRASLEFQAPPGSNPSLLITYGADYNHRNPARPLDKISQYYIDFLSLTIPAFDATVSNVKVQQIALDDPPIEGRLVKTIQESVNQPIPNQPAGSSTFQYLARYRTDFDFWSGTFQDFLKFPDFAFAVPPDTDNFTAQCAQLTTAVGVNQGTCIDLGIDVTNLPFLDLLVPSDPQVNLPVDFPPTPTF